MNSQLIGLFTRDIEVKDGDQRAHGQTPKDIHEFSCDLYASGGSKAGYSKLLVLSYKL